MLKINFAKNLILSAASLSCLVSCTTGEIMAVNRTETINNDKFENFFAGSSLNIQDTEVKKSLTVKGSLTAKNISTNNLTVNGFTTLASSKVKGKSVFKKDATITAVTFNDTVTLHGDALITNCHFKMPVYVDGGDVTFVNSHGTVVYPTGENSPNVTFKKASSFTDVYFYARMGSITIDKTSNILRPITGNLDEDELVTSTIRYHRMNKPKIVTAPTD